MDEVAIKTRATIYSPRLDGVISPSPMLVKM
jgi:hypothetical protein